MNKLFFFIILFVVTTNLSYSQNYTVSGYVTINISGETLINSSVIDKKSGSGTVSNSYGFYSITLPKGEVDLNFSYVGLAAQSHNFNLINDTVINVELLECTELSEVLVVGTQKGLNVKSSQMSAVNIPVTQIKGIPGLLGETDLIKALQLLPGVKAGVDGSAGMFVRGGVSYNKLLPQIILFIFHVIYESQMIFYSSINIVRLTGK
ncbi:MAG: carboxypeptidase-like regulatory domain-containing protein [Paludibacter sp.]|nr:carboxypeptidase-like regulatory domain-containing protein [Paludibacter sp.]